MIKRQFPVFRAVGNKVLFNNKIIQGQPSQMIDSILSAQGILELPMSPTPMAVIRNVAQGQLHGASTYRERACAEDAPEYVSCSTFTQWVYSQLGIALPKLAIQQYQAGEALMDTLTLKVGDLLFKRSDKNYWDQDEPQTKIGHVGIVTDVDSAEGEVIHATAMSGQVISVFLNDFMKRGDAFVAACRIVPKMADWRVLEIPDNLLSRVTSSDDLKWLVMEDLPEPS